MKIAVLEFGRFKCGGIVTYGFHFKKSLESINHKVNLIAAYDKIVYDTRVKFKPDIADLVNKSHDAFILNGSFYDKNKEEDVLKILKSIKVPKYYFVHDTVEKVNALLSNGGFEKIFCVGKKIRKWLKSKTDIPVHYLIHPYCRWSSAFTNRFSSTRKFVISTSRMDFDKHYDIMLNAAEAGVIPRYRIFCDYVHRPYIYFNLCRKVPIVASDPFTPEQGWRKKYLRPGIQFNQKDMDRVYSHARALIDATEIKGDGARSQYTMLEAFDYGVPVIISCNWDPKQKYWIPGFNCLTIDPKDMSTIGKAIRLLKNEEVVNLLVSNGYHRLKRHNPIEFAKQFVDIIGQ